MPNRFSNFMYGRYGNDQLNRMLSWTALVLIIVNFFVRTGLLSVIALLLLLLLYVRMFSRNIQKRAAENQKYLQLTARLRRGKLGDILTRLEGFGQNPYGYGGYAQRDTYQRSRVVSERRQAAMRRKAQREQKKIYRFFVCPSCSQKVRVPKGKGRIEITCPKCRTSFIKKS